MSRASGERERRHWYVVMWSITAIVIAATATCLVFDLTVDRWLDRIFYGSLGVTICAFGFRQHDASGR